MPVALARAAFGTGRGYSEIMMGDADSWITFVMRDEVARLLRALRHMLDQL
jgi:hypothetical protein